MARRPVAIPRGALTVSIDLEILWGVWDNAPTKIEARCADLERTIADRLLELFRRYEIRVTWATVGRLLDDSRGFDGLRGSPACWFAPDIVDRINSDSIDHEIGSHSYGHIYFHASTHEQVRKDLLAAKTVHETHGLPFNSFVFPRNQVGHLDLLRDVGIKVYRTTDAGILDFTERHARRLRPLVNLAEKAVAFPSPAVQAYEVDGMIELPTSMLLMARNGARRIVHPRALSRKLTRGIRRAANERRVFHLWFHPSNFYDAMEAQLGILTEGLEEAARLRDLGQLDVRTMGDYAVELVTSRCAA